VDVQSTKPAKKRTNLQILNETRAPNTLCRLRKKMKPDVKSRQERNLIHD
jgi:hypothetical protein